MWKDIPGWFEIAQGDILQLFCKDKIYLEVGSYKGRSTICAAEVAKKVYAIDTFKATDNGQSQSKKFTTMDEFLINISDYDNIEYRVGQSESISKEFQDNSIDIILIDGLHDYDAVILDKKSWWPKLKINGYMLFHDYAPSFSVKPAVDKMFLEDEIMSQICLAWVQKEK